MAKKQEKKDPPQSPGRSPTSPTGKNRLKHFVNTKVNVMTKISKAFKNAARQKLQHKKEQRKKESFDCKKWFWKVIDAPYYFFAYFTCLPSDEDNFDKMQAIAFAFGGPVMPVNKL